MKNLPRLLFLLALLPGLAPSAPAFDAAEADACLKQLADEDFEARRRAFAALLNGGDTARAALEKFRTDDPEARAQAQRLDRLLKADRPLASVRAYLARVHPQAFGAAPRTLGEPLAGNFAHAPDPAPAPTPPPASPENVPAAGNVKRGGGSSTPGFEEGMRGWLEAARGDDGCWQEPGQTGDGGDRTALALLARISCGQPFGEADARAFERLRACATEPRGRGCTRLLRTALAVWTLADLGGLGDREDARKAAAQGLRLLAEGLLKKSPAGAEPVCRPAAEMDLFEACFAAAALHAGRCWAIPCEADLPAASAALRRRVRALRDAEGHCKIAEGEPLSAPATLLGRLVACWSAEGDEPPAWNDACLAAVVEVEDAQNDACTRDVFFEFAALAVAFQEGGEPWKRVSEAFKDRRDAYERSGTQRFARPTGAWRNAGPVFATSLALLDLSIYVRSSDPTKLTSLQMNLATRTTLAKVPPKE